LYDDLTGFEHSGSTHLISDGFEHSGSNANFSWLDGSRRPVVNIHPSITLVLNIAANARQAAVLIVAMDSESGSVRQM
jgi:prepilin-type processing-associated H-X9-DG protein